MKSRKANILSSNIHSYAYPELTVEISVSAGTYIRSIANDLGDILGSG
jgi:tRNA U55 pseudouridine synthase TruB